MSIIPNSFQTPNVFIDKLMHYLTPGEVVVLTYATRHILGWQDKITARMANISLSQFVQGNARFSGCGMSKPAVISALGGLARYAILIPVGDPGSKGQAYFLQDNDEAIDWDGLQDRLISTQDQNKARTAKARQVVSQTDKQQSVPLTENGKSDRHIKSQTKPSTKDTSASDNQWDSEFEDELRSRVKDKMPRVKLTKDEYKARMQQAMGDGARMYKEKGAMELDGHWPADVADLVLEFTKLFGRQATDAERSYWIKSTRELLAAGITVDALQAGYKKMINQGLTVKSPASVFAYADEYQRKLKVKAGRGEDQPDYGIGSGL